jgi:Mg/Co/Ni transporter MgtE
MPRHHVPIPPGQLLTGVLIGMVMAIFCWGALLWVFFG